MALEFGLDGFTMDQLAERVGVSRRTLFNYVPSKIDAVLGLYEPPSDHDHEVFLAGGPTGHLLTDIAQIVSSSLTATATAPAELAMLRDLLCQDARLMTSLRHRIESGSEEFTQLIAQRERDQFDPTIVPVLRMLILGGFAVALESALENNSVHLFDHFNRVLATARDLLDNPHS
jgi:AcrR family transcriptional regulator